jgi:hypothetical protein
LTNLQVSNYKRAIRPKGHKGGALVPYSIHH